MMKLTRRELQMVEMTAAGMLSQEIVAATRLRRRTIERYRQQARAKLGARNSCHMVAIAIRENLIDG